MSVRMVRVPFAWASLGNGALAPRTWAWDGHGMGTGCSRGKTRPSTSLRHLASAPQTMGLHVRHVQQPT
jgi:hypothetical protein